MNPLQVPRKRIWQVDCLFLQTVLASSFEWRDLANILAGTGHPLDDGLPAEVKEIHCFRLIHGHSHSENTVSLVIESLLNRWHERTLNLLGTLSARELCDFVLRVDMRRNRKLGGIFWALGTDPRPAAEGARRCLMERFQILSIRERAGRLAQTA